MDWRGQPFAPPFGDIDVLARLRELTQQPAVDDVEAALRESQREEEMRALEAGIVAEAMFQSQQEALANAQMLASRSLIFQVYAIGYTRAGESEVCCADENERSGGDAAVMTRSTGAWRASVPLFCFMVTQTGACGDERSHHCITKSRDDFASMHELLEEEIRRDGCSDSSAHALPKLPGRKLLNANAHAHLQKRLGRYQEYLSDLARHPVAKRTEALQAFLGEPSRDPVHRRPSTCLPEAQSLLQHVTPSGSFSGALPRSATAFAPALAASGDVTAKTAATPPPHAGQQQQQQQTAAVQRSSVDQESAFNGHTLASCVRNRSRATSGANSGTSTPSTVLAGGGAGQATGAHELGPEALNAELRRLRARVAQLEKSQMSWSQVLQQFLFNTLLDTSKAEAHRTRLEYKLQKAIAAKKDGKVSGIKVSKLKLPSSWEGVPELVLQSNVGDYSIWTVVWHPRQLSCDLVLSGKRMGMTFTCAATITLGLVGEFEARFVGGEVPSLAVSFLKEPVLQVQTSGTQVSVASMPIPLQEAVDKEIRQHVLKVLKKSIFPPRTMTFTLSASEGGGDAENAAAPTETRSSSRNPQHAHASKGAGGGRRVEGAAAGKRPRSYIFGEGARKEGELAMAAAEKAVGPGGRADASAHMPEVRLYSSSEAEDESDDGAETALPAGEVREESLGLTVARVKSNGPLLLAKVDPGRPAAKACLIEGDELVEIGMQTVTHKDLMLIARLLAWPAGDERKVRLVQLSIHRGRSLQHVNIEQRATDTASTAAVTPPPLQDASAARGVKGRKPERQSNKDGRGAGGGEEDGFGGMANISAPTNVQKRASVTRDPVSGELVGVPKDWQKVCSSLELVGSCVG